MSSNSSEKPRTPHPSFSLPLDHPEHPWTLRGYRDDLANLPYSPLEDPLGEVAYHRAFAKVAAQDPNRVPCPSFFPKSHTARSFTTWKDSVLFSPKPEEKLRQAQQANPPPPTANPTVAQQSLPPPRYSEDAPFQHHRINGNTHSKSSSGSSTPSLRRELQSSPRQLRAAAGPDVSMADVPRTAIPTTDMPMTDIPMTLEPKLNAPAGPSRMLR